MPKLKRVGDLTSSQSKRSKRYEMPSNKAREEQKNFTTEQNEQIERKLIIWTLGTNYRRINEDTTVWDGETAGERRLQNAIKIIITSENRERHWW